MTSEKIKKLDDNEISDVSGGSTDVYNPRFSSADLAFKCDMCKDYVMKVDTHGLISGGDHELTWKCPKCGTVNHSVYNLQYKTFGGNKVSGTTSLVK